MTTALISYGIASLAASTLVLIAGIVRSRRPVDASPHGAVRSGNGHSSSPKHAA